MNRLAKGRMIRVIAGMTLLVTVIMLSAPIAALAGAPLDLVLHLPMDEGTGPIAYDTSGFGNDGDIFGATWVGHLGGGALSFEGPADYVDCGNSVLAAGAFTAAMWIKPAVTQQRGILDLITGASGLIAYQRAFDGNNRQMFGFRGEHEVMSPVESITVGEWNHVALVYDGGAKNSLTSYRILIDGVEQVLAFGSGPIGGISDVNYIGREKNSTGFQGAIDDVYVYNRALSSQEIIQYYEDATSPPLQPLPATSNIFVFAAAVSVGILGYALLRRVPRSQS